MDNTITITLAEYERLTYDSEKLDCLEACGVDNWAGYSDAMDMMEEFKG